MAKKITIRGFIGFDENATPEFLERELSGVGDVEILFSSPGGLVFPGLEMGNMLRNHSGHVTAKIVGLAASMSAHIPMMANEVIVEDDAIFMIHNPMGGIFGADFRSMEKHAKFLKSVRDILAKALIRKSGKTESQVHKLMNDESFFFGKEIADEGFADSVVIHSGDNESDRETAMALAHGEVKDCIAMMKEHETEARADFERAAAYLKTEPTAHNNPPAAAGKTQVEVQKMTLKELLAANPDAKAEYDADINSAKTTARAEGETAGKEVGKAEGIAEMKAVSDLVTPIISSSHYPDAVKTRVIEKAQSGDIEAVKDYVSMYDMTAEGIATAKAIDEQSPDTPAVQQTEAEKTEGEFQARLKKEGRA
jgi:ATP-dependent protease ClpP protease subunit